MARKEWTGPEHARLLELWSQNYTARQIGGILGRTYAGIEAKLRELEAPKKEGRPPLERVKSLCVCDDWAQDCWIWTGAMSGGKFTKTPVINVGGGKNPRRVAMEALGLWKEGARFCASTCGEPKCVSPFHGVARTPREHVRFQFRAGHLGNAKHVAAVAKMMRERSKLTAEDVAEMRRSHETHKALAQRYGISMGHVQKIRSGERWRDTGGASVFNWTPGA